MLVIFYFLLLSVFFRNTRRELNDIRFEFAVGKDSADGIASELVGAGLVDSRDFTAITVNLQKLIEQRDTLKVVTFQLVSLIIFIGIFWEGKVLKIK